MGHRAIYSDGWKAVTRHTPGVPFDQDDWELYHLTEDRSECRNLAAELPDRLAELIDLWWAEAAEQGVLPLDDRTLELFGARFRDRSPHPADRHYTYYPPMTPLPGQVAASISGRSWDLAATVDRPVGANGVLYASGTENSGMSVFVQDDHLVFDYNCFGDHHIATSEVAVPVGGSVIGVQFRRTGQNGIATLVIDGEPVGSVDIPFVMLMMSSIGPSVGFDHGSPVSSRYSDEFPFEGHIARLDIDLVSARRIEAVTDPDTDGRATMSRQ